MTSEAVIPIKTTADTSGAKKVTSAMDALAKSIKRAEKAGSTLAKTQVDGLAITANEAEDLKKVMMSAGNAGARAFEKTKESLTKVRKEMDFAFLTFLFAGMAMQRFGTSIIKSLFATYTLVRGEQAKLNKDVLSMRASFEFLKFSIISALEQSKAWEVFKNAVLSITEGLGKFFAKHPNWATSFVIAAGAIAAIGTAAIAWGTILQTGMLIKETAAILKEFETVKKAIEGIKKAKLALDTTQFVTDLKSFLARTIPGLGGLTVKTLLGAGAVAVISWKLMDTIGEKFNVKAFKSNIAKGLGVAFGAIAFGAGVPLVPAITLAVGFTLAAGAVASLGKRLREFVDQKVFNKRIDQAQFNAFLKDSAEKESQGFTTDFVFGDESGISRDVINRKIVYHVSYVED